MVYDNNNRGALFKAREKKSDNSPDYTGKLTIDGREWSLSAWLKESKSGERYMSLSVREPLKGTFKPRGYSREEAGAEVSAKFGPGAYPNKQPGFPPGKADFNDELPDDSILPF